LNTEGFAGIGKDGPEAVFLLNLRLFDRQCLFLKITAQGQGFQAVPIEEF
jgi:hypothetical protein